MLPLNPSLQRGLSALAELLVIINCSICDPYFVAASIIISHFCLLCKLFYHHNIHFYRTAWNASGD